MKKSDRHNAIRARYARAIANMYHNATPRYPTIDDPETCERFQAWFEDAAHRDDIANASAGEFWEVAS